MSRSLHTRWSAAAVALTASLALVSTLVIAADAAADNAAHLAAALTAPSGDTTRVQVEVIAADGDRGDELVLVTVGGGDESARQARALLVREQMTEQGVAPEQVIIETAGQE